MNDFDRKADGHFEGYLKKWTNYMKQYQRRWFVYENGYLRYYRNREDVGELTKYEVYLRGCRLMVNKNLGFSVIKKNETLLTVYAYDKNSFEEWLKVLRFGIIYSNQNDLDKGSTLSRSLAFSSTTEEYSNKNIIGTIEISEKLHELSNRIQQILLTISNEEHHNPTTLKQTNLKIFLFLTEFKDLNEKLRQNITSIFTEMEKAAEGAVNTRALQENNNLNYHMEDNHLKLSNMEETFIASVSTDIGPIISEDEEFYDATEAFDSQSRNSKSNAFTDETNPRRNASAPSTVYSMPHVRSYSDLVASPMIPTNGHRSTIPNRPDVKLNLWKLIKNMIGRDLSRVPLPVDFNEPISMLQRVVESLEYSSLLDKACSCQSTLFQLCYTMAFAVSTYASTAHRTGKPFNPLLGETFECDRTSDLGWKCLVEQVSHHPPVCVLHAEGNGWVLWETYEVKSKFMATYLEIHPQGLSQLKFTRTGMHITWTRAGTTVNNLVIGSLYIDQFGSLEMSNKTTNEKAIVEFHPYRMFSSDNQKKITGVVKDSDGVNQYSLLGRWDSFFECCKIIKNNDNTKTGPLPTVIWKANELPLDAPKMYYFSSFTCSLNEPDSSVAPTDSRYRPDQRAMENQDFETANLIKSKLENNQRERTKRLLQQAIDEGRANKNDAYEAIYNPTWFCEDPEVDHKKSKIYSYKGGYWEAKSRQDWKICPKIYE